MLWCVSRVIIWFVMVDDSIYRDLFPVGTMNDYDPRSVDIIVCFVARITQPPLWGGSQKYTWATIQTTNNITSFVEYSNNKLQAIRSFFPIFVFLSFIFFSFFSYLFRSDSNTACMVLQMYVLCIWMISLRLYWRENDMNVLSITEIVRWVECT